MKRKQMQVNSICLPTKHVFERIINAKSCITLTLITLLALLASPVLAQSNHLWLTGGQNSFNTRYAATENKISVTTAGSLAVKWVFTTDGDVSATPAVDGSSVYFPDWAGNLYKLDASTGQLAWKKSFKDYTGQNFSFARATPAVAGGMLIVGTQLGNPPIGAHLLGIDKSTGALLWKTKLDDHFASIVTQSAVTHGDRVYVGVASLEENFAADPNYPCCSFRGSLVCLNANTGQILWKTYTTPAGKGYSGVAVWGSTPVIDAKRGSVYITTGNNYTVPQAAINCNAPGKTPQEVRDCIMAVDGGAENHFDAIMALDLATGSIKWSTSVIPFDAWTVACFFGGPNCPDNAGPDFDFGQGAALFTAGTGANKRELLGAGQKSGIYWTVNPDNGQVVWKTEVGPGGTLGGLQWGSAVDGKNIYTAISNNGYIPHLMTKGPGAGTVVSGGFWAALDAATGAVKWEYAATNPPTPIPGFPPAPAGSVAINTGMVTAANGVVFAGAMDAPGTMYAFNAATGDVLWKFESGGTVNSGAAVVNGTVYWGSGYSNFGLGTPNNKFYAFHVPGANNSVTNANTLTTPLADDGAETITVYPSPARNAIKVTAGNNGRIQSIRLYDMSGRMVKESRPSGVGTFDFETGSVPAGNYMIHVTTATKTTTTKVSIVQ